MRCRLDRAVANSLWAENYPTARCQYLNYEGSDHKLLISFLDPTIMKRKSLFRYDRRLSTNEEAQKLIRDTWASSSEDRVMERLASTRSAIAVWNKRQNLNSKILIDQLKQDLEDALTSTLNDTALIQDINAKLNVAYLAEEAFWKQ